MALNAAAGFTLRNAHKLIHCTLAHPHARAHAHTKREAESTTLRRRLRLLWKTLCGLLCLGTAVSAVVTLVAAIELRRHLGRSFFALPLSVHLLLDSLLALSPLLAARGDGEGKPPPPIPTSQVCVLLCVVLRAIPNC